MLFSPAWPPHDFRSRRSWPCRSQTGATHTYTKARIFPVRYHSSMCFAPLTLTPQISGLKPHVLVHAYARASPCATYIASIRCVIPRALRSSRPVPSLFFSCHPLSVSRKPQKPFPCAFDRRISRRPSHQCSSPHSYLIITQKLQRYRVIGSLSVRKHSLLMMTGVALVGRRWADRQCRDRTVSFRLLFPLSNIHEIITCAKD
jgi:hypothetical protein